MHKSQYTDHTVEISELTHKLIPPASLARAQHISK